MYSRENRKKISCPEKVIAVTNRKLCDGDFLDQIKKICQMKPQAIILREKDLSEEEYRILSEEVLSVCKKYEIPCILHKFWKTALELECTSVHLPLPELRKLPEDVKEQVLPFIQWKMQRKQKDLVCLT